MYGTSEISHREYDRSLNVLMQSVWDLCWLRFGFASGRARIRSTTVYPFCTSPSPLSHIHTSHPIHLQLLLCRVSRVHERSRHPRFPRGTTKIPNPLTPKPQANHSIPGTRRLRPRTRQRLIRPRRVHPGQHNSRHTLSLPLHPPLRRHLVRLPPSPSN